MSESAAEPLNNLIRKLRKPAPLRELMAACLRSIYMGDPFTAEDKVVPRAPQFLFDEVLVADHTLAGIRCVVYTPKIRSPEAPLMLYMHGGGFVVGCSEDTDYVTRMLCHSNQAVVVSVNYSLAPEIIFPGELNECENVLKAAISQSPQLGIRPTYVYLAGDSAGANLACALHQRIKQQKSLINGLILLAPWLDMKVESYESYNRLAPTGIIFDAAFLAYARASYVTFEQWADPMVSPLCASPVDMPPAIALVGTNDPLLDQSLKLKQMASDLGCTHIEVEVYTGMPHCFYSFPNLFDEEKNCYERISEFIRKREIDATTNLKLIAS